MRGSIPVRILQIGLGGFGKNHLRAWTQMGLGKDLNDLGVH